MSFTGFGSQCSDEDPFQVLLDIFGFISLDAILSSINTINCVTRVTPELEYLFLDGRFKVFQTPFLPYSWFSKKMDVSPIVVNR